MTDPAFENALMRTKEIELTTTGRTSGRAIAHPVWFVRQGEKLYLLPVGGADSHWYKNVLKTPTIRLAADGTKDSARAAPITDPAKVQKVVEAFRAKYGAGDVQANYPKLEVAVEVAPA
jgi:deazaflavin-dependent oxidoreductase (nitroreductase family)